MDKKKIMKTAWNNFKYGPARFQRSFSLCLKVSWEIEKRPKNVWLTADDSAQLITSMINAGVK